MYDEKPYMKLENNRRAYRLLFVVPGHQVSATLNLLRVTLLLFCCWRPRLEPWRCNVLYSIPEVKLLVAATSPALAIPVQPFPSIVFPRVGYMLSTIPLLRSLALAFD